MALSTPSSSTPNHAESATLAEPPLIPVSAWYSLAVLTLIYVCHSVDRSVISIVLQPVKQEFGLTDSQVGVLTGLGYAFFYTLAGIPLGYLIDRVNRRNLLALLVTIWSAATAVCGLTQNYLQLLLARLAVGASEAGGAPTALSMIGDLFPSSRRATAVSIFWLSTALGTAVSFAVGGLVAAQYGWRAAFWVAGMPGIALALLLFMTIREPVRGAMEPVIIEADIKTAPKLVDVLAVVIRDKPLRHLWLAMSLKAAVLSGVLIWVAAYLMRTFDLPIASAGIIVGSCIAVCGGLGSLLGGWVGDRAFRHSGLAGLPRVAALCSVATAFTCGLLALSPSLLIAITAFALFEVCSRMHSAPGYSCLIGRVSPDSRGVVMSLMQMGSNFIGYGLGPFVVGLVSDLAGSSDSLRWGLLVMALVSLWAGGHFVMAWRGLQRPHSAD